MDKGNCGHLTSAEDNANDEVGKQFLSLGSRLNRIPKTLYCIKQLNERFFAVCCTCA